MGRCLDQNNGPSIVWGPKRREYQLIKEPVPHILVDSRKELHGWWPGKRECTSERMLVNPYNGCSVGCFFCYSRALPGYFQLFRKKHVVTVFRDFDRVVARQLDSISVAACGYLSPVTDPFQEIEHKYHLSEKLISVFLEHNLPIDFVTKSIVPDCVIRRMAEVDHCFGQISILTPREEIRSRLMARGASTKGLFLQVRKLARSGLHTVCRIDPVIPYVTDRPDDLSLLVRQAADNGANHIIASVLDVPIKMASDVWPVIRTFGEDVARRVRKLYTERIGASQHASINYRRDLFARLRDLCDRHNLTFALCMEYDIRDEKAVGLNREFMTSTNCEGIDIPIYVRRGERFEPIIPCDGACLTCQEPVCGISDLALGRRGWEKPGFTLRDYRRWSREFSLRSRGR